jgi:serine O-acetyltransferase
MSSQFKKDFFRYTGKQWNIWSDFKYLVTSHSLCFLFFLRKMQEKPQLLNKIILNHLQRKYGLEISYENSIGSGFYIGHAFNITLNPNAVLGKNVNIHKGVTIGQENRGKRKGAPVIGDNVWIGVNATIVGKVKIGNNVLIVPNSYVNFDVPDNSVVLGNPAKVIPNINATEGYINRII